MRPASNPRLTTVDRPAATEPTAAAPPRMGWRGDLVTVLLAAWLIAGLFIDGWAHTTRPQLETFFTPWHAVFYSGFAATAAWMCWSVWVRRPVTGPWRTAVPAGYGLGLAGLALFLVSGLGDLSWHLAFGIERDIAALLSPTHLGLFAGAFLIVTTPLRSAWANPGLGRRVGLGRLLPAVVSLTLAGSLAAFMFQDLHPMYENLTSIGDQLGLRERFSAFQYQDVYRLTIEAGVPGFMLATAFLFGPLLFLVRRWRPPVGSALIVLGTQSLLVQALTGFADPGLAVLGVLGAVAVEALLAGVRPSPTPRWRLRGFCAVAPVVFWGVYFGGIGLHDGGLGWKAEIWGGTLVWSGLTLLALAMVMFPPRRAAGDGGDMTQSENKALVARYFDQVLTRGHVAALDDLLAPGFRSWLPDGSSVGAGPYRDAVLASRQAFPDLAVTVLDQVAEGDRVATRWQARGTHRGAFAGVPATGRPVTITAIHIHRVVGGRLTEHWEAINLLPLLHQLGVAG